MSGVIQSGLHCGAVGVMSQSAPQFRRLRRGHAVNGRQQATWTDAYDPTKVLNPENNATKQTPRGNASKGKLEKKNM